MKIALSSQRERERERERSRSTMIKENWWICRVSFRESEREREREKEANWAMQGQEIYEGKLQPQTKLVAPRRPTLLNKDKEFSTRDLLCSSRFALLTFATCLAIMISTSLWFYWLKFFMALLGSFAKWQKSLSIMDKGPIIRLGSGLFGPHHE